jgi:transcriptional regulator with XRE-family HTH domain
MSGSAKITGGQIAAARALTRMEQAELARAANVSVATLRRMEASEGPAVGMANNVAAIRSALEAAGVEFIAENGGGPGVRLRKGYAGPGSITVDQLNAENDE